MNAIIFGAAGQDGYYLTKLLEAKGIAVTGIGRPSASGVGITDYEQVSALVRAVQPAYIFHLAANSTTRHDVWKENHETISTGTLCILEAVKEHAPAAKVFLSGSGLQFRNEGQPINERAPFEAGSIYAVSRIHMVYAARYYRTLGVKAYVGYFFHHDSPLRSERHMSARIIAAVKRIAQGSTEQLVINDLAARKEFGFAGDIVQAVWTLVQQDNVVEAVLGTGKAYSMQDWAERCFGYYGLDWHRHVTSPGDYVSPFKVLVSDPATIFALGWRPQVDMDGLLKLMI